MPATATRVPRKRKPAKSTVETSSAAVAAAECADEDFAGTDRRTAWHRRAEQLIEFELDFIPNPEFSKRGAEDRILDEYPARLDVSAYMTNHPGNSSGRNLPLIPLPYQVPLLKKDEEARLFEQMNFAKYMANRLRKKLDVENPEKNLVRRIEFFIRLGEDIRDRIVVSNLRLVISIARRLCSAKYPFEDLVSDGNLILMRAVEKFDFARGYRFSTYATHAVQRDVFRQFQRKGRDSSRFIPGSAEYLEELSEGETDERHTPHEFSVFNRLVSLMGDQLDEREHYILKARYGIADEPEPLKLRSIAEKLGLSKERVRQLQNRAIEKLQESIAWDAALPAV